MKAPKYDANEVAHILQGCIDTHVHSSPDVVPRKMDDLALARDAARSGLRGFVIKCHISPTESRANLVQQMVPDLQVCGGIALNFNTGGLNPDALLLSIQMGAKIVWMPTVAAANHLQAAELSSHMRAIGGGIVGKGITIHDDEGKLKTEVIEILEIIKEADIILATGHLSPGESIDLANTAIGRGVRKVLFTHPELSLTRLSIEEQKKLAAKGVYFERCWVATTDVAGEESRISPEEMASAIRIVGPASTVMATDHGQVANPPPVEAMRSYIEAMLGYGITPAEIELMAKYNPAQLLGL